MELRGDCFPPVQEPRRKDIRYWFGEEDNFGEWIELCADDGTTVHIDPIPDDEYLDQIDTAREDEDPLALEELWVLIYHVGRTGRRYEANKRVTTRQAKRVFEQFLSGDDGWRSRRQWTPIPSKRRGRGSGR